MTEGKIIHRKPSRSTETSHSEVPLVKEHSPAIVSVEDQQNAALKRILTSEVEKGPRELKIHQEDFVGRFLNYYKKAVEKFEKEGDPEEPRMARIEAAPRTGKTTMAGEMIRRTGLSALYFCPTPNLVTRAIKELQALLPGKKVVEYTGVLKEDLSGADVIVATYSVAQACVRTKKQLPPEMWNMPLVFADEGQESTTESRMNIMRNHFDPRSIRVALSGTPDYSEKRKLEDYYPDLIHIMTTPEAVELGLLSEFEYGVYEIDLDASEVNVVGGDLSVEIGRVLTGLPVFKLFEKIRYHETNRYIPALGCFRTKQQANDACAYLNLVKPQAAKRVGVITEDTENREEMLAGFAAGEYDTLLTVNILVRGWDAEQCKLLIDVDPTISLVRAGQKFTRPMTKKNAEDARVAKIYSVVPKNLKYPPLLPPDVLMSGDKAYPTGRVFGKRPDPLKETKPSPPVLAFPENIEGVTVTPLAHIREYGGLKALNIDRENTELIHEIVFSGYQQGIQDEDGQIIERDVWLTESLYSYRNFQNTFFQHKAFTGFGRVLLWSFGIRNADDFRKFVTKIFPEQQGSIFLAEHESSDAIHYAAKRKKILEKITSSHSSERDIAAVVEALQEDPDSKSAKEAMRVITGPSLDADTGLDYVRPDPLLWRVVEKALKALPKRLRSVLLEHALQGKTFEEIGNKHKITRERARQVYAGALAKIKASVQTELENRSGEMVEPKKIDSSRPDVVDATMNTTYSEQLTFEFKSFVKQKIAGAERNTQRISTEVEEEKKVLAQLGIRQRELQNLLMNADYPLSDPLVKTAVEQYVLLRRRTSEMFSKVNDSLNKIDLDLKSLRTTSGFVDKFVQIKKQSGSDVLTQSQIDTALEEHNREFTKVLEDIRHTTLDSLVENCDRLRAHHTLVLNGEFKERTSLAGVVDSCQKRMRLIKERFQKVSIDLRTEMDHLKQLQAEKAGIGIALFPWNKTKKISDKEIDISGSQATIKFLDETIKQTNSEISWGTGILEFLEKNKNV